MSEAYTRCVPCKADVLLGAESHCVLCHTTYVRGVEHRCPEIDRFVGSMFGRHDSDRPDMYVEGRITKSHQEIIAGEWRVVVDEIQPSTILARLPRTPWPAQDYHAHEIPKE